jgi:hypothetical protein
MTAVATRKANLGDLMILTASTAFGLALARYYWMAPLNLTPTLGGPDQFYFVPQYPSRTIRWWATIGSCFLTAWSVALLLVRLRTPRPSFKAIVWGPGFLVPAVATIAVLAFFADHFVTVARNGWPDFKVPAIIGSRLIYGHLDFFALDVMPGLRKATGVVVIVALLLSVVIRRRRLVSDWVDGLGMVVGLAWILVYFS